MKIKNIPLEDLLEPESPIRSVADDEKMAELVGSVDKVGLLQPLVVRADGDKFRIVAGHRRYIALMAMGAKKAPCNVVEVTETEAAILSLEENLKREDVNPLDEAKYYQFLVAQHGLTHKEIGERTGKGREYVTKRIGLLRLDPETKEAIEQGRLVASTARELGRIPDLADRALYRTYALDRGASTAQVKKWADHVLLQPQSPKGGATVYPPIEPVPPERRALPECFVCSVDMDHALLDYRWLCRNCQAVLKAAMEVEE